MTVQYCSKEKDLTQSGKDFSAKYAMEFGSPPKKVKAFKVPEKVGLGPVNNLPTSLDSNKLVPINFAREAELLSRPKQ